MAPAEPPFIFVHPHFKTGGSEVQTMLLAQELVSREVETHLVLHKASGKMLDRLPSEVKIHETGVESHAALPIIAARLNRILAGFDQGNVIVKLWASLFSVQYAAMRNPQLRFVMCEDLDPLLHWQQTKFGAVKSRIIKSIFRNSPYVTANTESIADAMCQAYDLRTRPSVLYGGIDPAFVRENARESQALSSSSDHPLRIVTVASLRERKGHARCLRALQELEVPWQWDVVGDGPLRGELERLCAYEPVNFHGVLSNPYGLISDADVLLHLPFSEAFGVAILEALCLGTPVVSSACKGPLEIFAAINQDKRRMTVVDAENSKDVRDVLERYGNQERPGVFDPPFSIERAADGWLSYLGELS